MSTTIQPRCSKCRNHFSSQRYEMGYKDCLDCSSETKWSAVPVINHKTGNEVQIVKDPAAVAEFMAKSSRVGFGTLRGVSGGYKPRQVNTSAPVVLPDPPPTDKVIGRRMLVDQFEQVGEVVMTHVERQEWEQARKKIQDALDKKEIWGMHGRKLNDIVDAFHSQTK